MPAAVPMMIDIFNHFMPRAHLDRLADRIPGHVAVQAFPKLKALWDVDERLRVLDAFDGLQQVVSLANPPIELVAPPNASPAIARRANDDLAALCARYPDRFPTFVASLPMNNPDAAVEEADRAILDLGARGVQVFTHVAGEPLSAKKFRPVFRCMTEHDLPVFVHPMRGPQFADYTTEKVSEDEIWFSFGWPYETSACMARLIYAGIFDEMPRLKIVTHHMGGMIPFFSGRIELGFRQIFEGTAERNPVAAERGLKRPVLDYFHMLYADTALNGAAGAIRCGQEFFGTGRTLFATDAPFDPQGGRALIGRTIEAVQSLAIGEDERERIFAGNARALLKI
jgi:uncharacterized protein